MSTVGEYFFLIGKSIPILLKDIKHPIKLKFIGYLQGREGLYCGFDLLEKFKGKNNGCVDGIGYFNTDAEMSGLFVPFYKVKEELDLFIASYKENTTNNALKSDIDTNALIIENEWLKKIIENQKIVSEEFSKFVSEIDPTISNWELEMGKKQEEINRLKLENDLLRQNSENLINDAEQIEKILSTPFKMNANMSRMTPIALSKKHMFSNRNIFNQSDSIDETKDLRNQSDENL
ncbi:hypothetical protein QEN19_002944 [Hanseniaspora menglaensis]